MSDDFDTDIRTTLHGAAATVERDEHRADRLIANARSGRAAVVPLRRSRPGWLAPLLAAAAVVVVAGAVLVATNVFGGNRIRPAAPTIPVPVGFRAVGTGFVSPDLGFAVGSWPCPGNPHRNVSAYKRGKLTHTGCAALIRTTDGGHSWSRIGFPQGVYVGNSTVGGIDAGCPDPPSKRCVDHVTFADARRGYLWSGDAIYWTTDGGRTWSHPSTPSQGVTWLLQIAGDYALRTGEEPTCSFCGAGLERMRIGAAQWQPALMVGTDIQTRENSLLAASGATAYFMNESPDLPARGARGDVFRSTDHGASWHIVWQHACGAQIAVSLAAGPDGSLAVMCQSGNGARHSVLRVFRPGHGATTGATIDDAPLRVVMLDQQHVVVASQFGARVLVYLSDDGGHTFTGPTPIPAYASPNLTPEFVNSSVGFELAAHSDGVAVTTDGGRTWQVRTFR